MVVFGRKYPKDREKIWKIGGDTLNKMEEYTFLGFEVERKMGGRMYKEKC